MIFESWNNAVNFLPIALTNNNSNANRKANPQIDNLNSENPEDWSNAVHSCRRLLQSLADKFFPPNPDGKSEIEKGSKKIKVGAENYINRLILFIESKSESERYLDIVGSHLDYIGNRIDSIYEASSKGTHTIIQSKEEAERYIIYTYLLIGDLVILTE